jgi:hypothetical protein
LTFSCTIGYFDHLKPMVPPQNVVFINFVFYFSQLYEGIIVKIFLNAKGNLWGSKGNT